MVWGPQWNQRRRKQRWVGVFISLCFLAKDAMSAAALSHWDDVRSCIKPLPRQTVPSRSERNHFFCKIVLVMSFFSAKDKITNALTFLLQISKGLLQISPYYIEIIEIKFFFKDKYDMCDPSLLATVIGYFLIFNNLHAPSC